jgi:hypothetical protein
VQAISLRSKHGDGEMFGRGGIEEGVIVVAVVTT